MKTPTRSLLLLLVVLMRLCPVTSFAPTSATNGRSCNKKNVAVLFVESRESQSARSLSNANAGKIEKSRRPWDAYQAQDRVATLPRLKNYDGVVAQKEAGATTNSIAKGADTQDATTTTAMMNDTVSSSDAPSVSEQEYQRGLLTIGFCTLVFASMSPVMHAALGGATAPPVLLLNAAVSVTALVGLVLSGPFLEQIVPKPSSLKEKEAASNGVNMQSSSISFFESATAKAGLELGMWKFLGTTANLYGLSLTTSDHGAFLIQLTTLIVPVAQGIMGVPIPQRIQASVALALGGVALFTQDHVLGAVVPPNQSLGDALCVVAAIFYATYDLRLFSWGKLVAARDLITTKIGTQAFFSVLLLAGAGWTETVEFLNQPDAFSPILIALVLWSGFMVNAIVPFLQVGGQQAIGPTRSQTIYASQPLWAAIMSFVFLGETIGWFGAVGGSAFLTALLLAATAEAPDPNCGQKNCEV